MVKEYLNRYNFDEKRFMAWVKSQGHNPHEAMHMIMKYSKDDKVFRDGNELCAEVIKDIHEAEMQKFFKSLEPTKDTDITMFLGNIVKGLEELAKKLGEIEELVTPKVDNRSWVKKVWHSIIGR